MVTVVSFVVVIGVMVVVHEFGHLVAAKAAGVRVVRFSVGFWKPLFGFTWRGTEYVVSAVPLGGYVRMAGGEEGEGTGAPDEFLSKPPWVRMLVYLAGPVMNLALAILLYAAVAKAGFTLYTFPNRVGGVLDTVAVTGEKTPSPARRAGFQPGDVIVAIDGQPTPYWYDLQRKVNAGADRPLRFDIHRDGVARTLVATPVLEPESGRGLVGLMPYQENDVFVVDKDGAAGKAGVVKGDRLVTVNGRPLDSFTGLVAMSSDFGAGRYVFGFEGPGGRRDVAVDYAGGDADALFAKLGVACGLVTVRRASTWEAAIPEGWRQTREVVEVTARGIAFVVRGRVKVTKALGGPITIARYAGETARAGITTFLAYMAFLSTMLGMLNLIPIPVLDGGQIVIAGVEAVSRRNLPAKVRQLATVVGLAVLGGLMALALFSDVTRLFTEG